MALLTQWMNLQLAATWCLVTQAEVRAWCAGLTEGEADALLGALQEQNARLYGDWKAVA